jgi:hypothetical protein
MEYTEMLDKFKVGMSELVEGKSIIIKRLNEQLFIVIKLFDDCAVYDYSTDPVYILRLLDW